MFRRFPVLARRKMGRRNRGAALEGIVLCGRKKRGKSMMVDRIVRTLRTVGREEDIYRDVVFPLNEEDILKYFEVKELNELRFADHVDGKVSVSNFNRIIREAPDRAAKIADQIEVTVKYLKKRMAANQDKNYKGLVEQLPLTFEDGMVWSWCMKEHYKHKDEKVHVRRSKYDLSVYYGDVD